MDVLIITRFYPPDTGGGGIAAYARYLAQGLVRARHRVRVISQMAAQSQRRRVSDGVEVYRIGAPELPYRWRRVPLSGRYTRFCNDVFYARAVRQHVVQISQQGAPDVVEYADFEAEGLFHPFSLAPAVVKLHTPHFVLRQFYTAREVPYDMAAVGWLEKRAIMRASGLSSPSHFLAQAVAEHCRLPTERIVWLPNPIDADFFSPDGREKSPPTVLYVGRLEARKGSAVFAEAIPHIARRFSNARFILLGADRASRTGGSQRAELHRYLETMGVADRVEFHGHASPEVFREHYRRASVFVMPSLFENCPYTLLEAMACGKAAAVSRASGMREMIVGGESGLFFEPGNALDLAERTLELLGDAALRQRLGEAARATVQRDYSLSVATEQTVAFYRDVLARV